MSRLPIGYRFAYRFAYRFSYLVACLVVLGSLTATGHAEDRKPAGNTKAGFWKILVKPKATWVLRDTITEDADSKTARIKVETYDVRKVGKADVARLRWTQIHGNDKLDIGGGTVMPTQVAVTSAGLYLMKASDDDAAIAAVLKHRPHRADPPKAYSGTRRNEGRFLRTGEDYICWGEEPVEGDGDCPDVCESEVCISATQGVTRISGMAAPNKSIWEQ